MTAWKPFRTLAYFHFMSFFPTNLISFQNESWRSFREMAGERGTPAVKMHAKVCNLRIFALRDSATLRGHSTTKTAARGELGPRALCLTLAPLRWAAGVGTWQPHSPVSVGRPFQTWKAT